MSKPFGSKALLISVGGTPEPIAYSINQHKPEQLIFFASTGSRIEIETAIRPLTIHKWRDQEIITTRDHQNLTVCIAALRSGLREKLELFGLGMDDLIVDYTGGTKTMSAALVLATVNSAVAYSYIGGRVRSKEGLGVVLDGSEAVLINPNPWDVLAIDLLRRMARQFNQGRFAEAGETAREAAQRVGARQQNYFQHLADLCIAYQRWNNFDYARVAAKLEPAYNGLVIFAEGSNDKAFLDFIEQVDRDRQRLRTLVPAFKALQSGKNVKAEGIRALVLDLVANAVRTVRLGHRYDDGVARLYSAVEKIAKAELLILGIDNSCATLEQLPNHLHEDYCRYLDASSGRLKFGLKASYQLLAELDIPAGLRYQARSDELDKVLGVRNSSLMVHGWAPINENVFGKMLEITLEFLDLSPEELPALPGFPET